MMIYECGLIVLIILIMAVLVRRSGNGSGYFVAILPLVILPAFHIVTSQIYHNLYKILPLKPPIAYIAIDACGLAIGFLFMGLISSQMKAKKMKLSYLIMCGGFSGILFCVLISKIATQLIF